MSAPWLTDEQVESLTRLKQPAAQMRELKRAGIPFDEVAGRPVVWLNPPPATETRKVRF